MTSARINHAALFDLESDNRKVYKLDVLRVGKVRPGKAPPSHTAINNKEEPPRMTRAMREVKDCLRDATMSLVHSDFTNENDVFAVEQWLLMETAALVAIAATIQMVQKQMRVNATTNLRLPRSPLQLPSVLQDISIGKHSLLRSFCPVEIPYKRHNLITLIMVLANL